MVDFGKVTMKAARGFSVGVGVFGSSFVGNTIADNTSLGNTGVALGEVGVGAAHALLSDELGNQLAGVDMRLANIADMGVEHVGYGVMGAGLAELADEMQTGAAADRVVTVNERSQGQSQSSGSGSGNSQQSSRSAEPFSLNTT